MSQKPIFTLSRLMQSTALLAVILAVYCGYHLYGFRSLYLRDSAPTLSNHAQKYAPNLLPELDIAAAMLDGSLYDFPDQFIDEMVDIWDADSVLFHSNVNTSTLTVESIMPSGILAELHGLPIQRAVAKIDSPLSLDDLFSYMTTADKGYVLIDPLKAMQDAKRKRRKSASYSLQSPVLSFSWGRGRLELDYEIFHMLWPFSHREFTVLNVIDADQHVFVSKSVVFPEDVYRNHIAKLRGAESGLDAAAMLNEVDTSRSVVRAVNNFALRIKKSASPQSSDAGSNPPRELKSYTFEMINFAAGIVPHRAAAHYVNSKLYFPLVVSRMRDVLKTVSESSLY